MSPRWLVSGHQTLGPTSVRITVREAFPGTDPATIASKTPRFVPMVVREGQKVAAPHERGSLLTYGAAIGTVTGRVTDEAGHPQPFRFTT